MNRVYRTLILGPLFTGCFLSQDDLDDARDGDGADEVVVSSREDVATLWLLDDMTELDFVTDSDDETVPHLRVPSDADPEEVMGLTDRGITFGDAAGVGDWNGDGRDDFAFGSGGRSGTDAVAAGSVFIITEPWSGDRPANRVYTTRIDGFTQQGGFGTDVEGPIDLNDDGRADFITSEPG